MAGEYRHEQVGDGGPQQAAGNDSGADRLLEPVTKHERQHHANGGEALVDRGGHGVIRVRLARTPAPLVDARTVSGRTQASLKNIGGLVGSF